MDNQVHKQEAALGRAVSLTLTAEELVEITGYTRSFEQLKWFRGLGVPAKRRADGTVSVAREHYLRAGTKVAPVESRAPRLKCERH
jgi:Domain of unknown function (DUF4224)